MDAAQRFFKQAIEVCGHAPDQITTDRHGSYPRAICEIIGNNIQHRVSKYLNSCLEQDHRSINQRYNPMRGFGSVESAARFCCAFDELRNYFRSRRIMSKTVSLR